MKKPYDRILCAGMALAVLLGGCAGEKTSAGSEKPVENSSVQEEAEGLERETAPALAGIVFEGKDLGGNVISEAVFAQSKLTMVNVWATYCNPCLSEMPGLGELAGEYETETFQIIGIVSDVQEDADEKAIDTVKALIETTGANYTHLLLNQSLYFSLLTDVTAVPTTFFVDKDGKVLDTVVGAMEKSAWEEKINALLEEE